MEIALTPDERIGWRFKGMPLDAAELTIGELAGQRRDLFAGGFGPVVLTLDSAALEHNLAAMAGWCTARGVSLAPHGKTTMAPALWARQLAHGACGITVAAVAQARVAFAAGVPTVLIANQVVDVLGVRWIGEQDGRVLFWVDSIDGVAIADAALAGARGAVEVLVEIGAAGGRGGCRTVPEAVVVAEAIARSSRLRLAGVAGFEGVLPVERVDAFLEAMGAVAAELDRRGLFDPADGTVLLTAGGSACFDRVAEVLGAVRLSAPSRVVLRSGCYLTHDHGSYAALTPAARGVADAPRFEPALRLWAQVSSRPEPDLALLACGRRDTSTDAGLPVAVLHRNAAGVVSPVGQARVVDMNDQHTFVRQADGWRVGDWVGLGISHPCTTFDRWQMVAVVQGDTVIDFVRTFF